MSCYRPIVCFKPADGGSVSFVERKDHREIKLPCGNCIGCRIAKREAWAVRCWCESRMHRSNAFITLTYDEAHMPYDLSLDYSHVQKWLRAMRQAVGPFSFFAAGEYGDAYLRPHYHVLAFGLDLADRVKCNSVFSRHDVFTSETVSRFWSKGFHTIGEVTYASARYCAVYTTKRIVGDMASDYYARVIPTTGECVSVVPEFGRMSLNPAIGLRWIKQYWRDVYVSGADGIVIDGKVKAPPRFFDLWMAEFHPEEFEAYKYRRFVAGADFSEHHSRDRLEVREVCAHAKQRFNRERYCNEV